MASSASQGGDDEIITAINVTPLVDIILVLLIIFMVTTEVIHEAERPRAIQVDLPAAASADQLLNQGMLNLVIDRGGTLGINGERSTAEAVDGLVAEIARRGATAQALISADERVAHGEVVALMDLLRVKGVKQIAINTQKQAIE